VVVVVLGERDRNGRVLHPFRYRDKIDKDDVGIDLPNLAEAYEAALFSLRELLAENIYNSKAPVEAAIISDESGREFMAIPAQDVLPEPFRK
jgi:hypothetical protein